MEDRSVDIKSPRVNASHEGDVAFWARLLDAHPDELRRAVAHAGSEISAVRAFLSARQLPLDFEGAALAASDWRTQ